MTSKSRKQPQQDAQQAEQAAPKGQQQGNERGGIAQRKPGSGDAPSNPRSGRQGFGRDEAQHRQRDNMTTDTSSAERGPDTNTNPASTTRSGTDKRSTSGPDQRSSDAGSRRSTESGTELDSPDIERHGGSGRDTMTPGGREST